MKLNISKIEKELNRQGITKTAFAGTLNISRQRLYIMLKTPTLKTAERLGKALDIYWKDLLIG
jgi:hypothetical protein